MSDPSVLIYARYFDLTQDYSLRDPLANLDTLALQKESTNVEDSDESVGSLVKRFEKAAREYVSLANDEPSSTSQDAAAYLESCTNHTIDNMSQVYDELLPDPYRIRKLKQDLPLLVLGGGDIERDVRKIKKGIDLQLVLDDFVDDEDDERAHPKKHQPFTSSTVSAEILEWSKTHFEAGMKKEKLDVSMETMRYIRKALSTSIEPSEMSKIMLGLTPEITGRDSADVSPIAEEEFEIEDETDTAESRNLLGPDENREEELPPVIKRELDMLSRLNAAPDEEYFLQNTQADREMDELFEQFTHQYSDVLGTMTRDLVEDECVTEFPAVKKRKLVHESDSVTIPQELDEINAHDLKTKLENFKFEIPDIPGQLSLGLPMLDLRVMLNQDQESSTFERKALDPGPLPFRVPSIHEALRESMPTQAQVVDKITVEEKPIISSGMLLWKEPGLRIVDHNDGDDEQINADQYPIEEWKPNTFANLQPDLATQPRDAYFFERSGHGRGTNGASHDTTNRQARTSFTIIKPEPVDNVCVKKESSPTRIDPPSYRSDLVPFNPFARAKARAVSELEKSSGDSVKNRAQGSIVRVQEQSGSAKLPNGCKDRKPTIQSSDTDLRSLLPDIKRNHFVSNVGLKDESILNDSLSSFLDLRGKQFKLPAVERVCKAAKIVDDPILSTQGSFAEEWFSDEPTLTPTETQPAQPVQQEVIPSIMPLKEPTTVVINSTLLQTKPLLIQCLENPDNTNLTLIYRDLDSREYRGPDLILNTTTSLFITNLQSLNQRPLPGQKSATGLSSAHDRVADLACSYSQIIVLVHHTTSTDSATQSKIALTQASFAVFCQNFTRTSPTNIRGILPCWVPCVDPASTSNTINAWVWQIISRCAYLNGSPKSPQPGQLAHPIMIQEETLWELFLCKAGMNPLAAQVVISSLKRSGMQSRTGTDQETIWGLRRLVAMSSQERTELFGQMIGVDVVERLNAVLCGSDGSAYRA